MEYLKTNGPEAVKALLEEHSLEPGAYRFPVKLSDEASDKEFAAMLTSFEREVRR